MNFSLSSATRSFLNVFLRVGGNLKDLHSRLEGSGSRALLPLLVVIHLSRGTGDQTYFLLLGLFSFQTNFIFNQNIPSHFSLFLKDEKFTFCES